MLWEYETAATHVHHSVGLHKCLETHIPQFLAHCICGSDLLKMSHQQLEYLKVMNDIH